LPDFLIIGAQKSGTSSLYNYLTQHPDVCPALVKEIRYFNKYFSKGTNWYRGHFPSSLYISYVNKISGRDMITGDGTPSYLSDPYVPRRVFEVIPQVKLIVLLRNPVDRAYSHYQHRFRANREVSSFEEVIKVDKEKLKDGWENLPITKDRKNLGEM
jgi:hypothetical protein